MRPLPPSLKVCVYATQPHKEGGGRAAKPGLTQGSGLPPVATGGLRGVGAIILAAGLSSRMVENKLLLPWTDGDAIISHVVRAYVDAKVEPLIVVTGRDADRVAAAVADYQPTLVHNPDYATGEILSSVKTGLLCLPNTLGSRRHRPCTATFIQPGDMPCITSDVITRLAAAHAAGWNVAPRYQAQRGHPVLLDRAYWRAMLDLPAGSMPRAALRDSRLRLVEVEDAGVTLDVDTREVYERLINQAGTAGWRRQYRT